jgi:DNA-binding CsgD family transcriptional regulator/tetratricopeptide (TPR) repeat protein
VTRIKLAALVRLELAALVAARTGRVASAGTVDALLARTNGNPFFAEQLLQADTLAPRPGDLPRGLTDVLRARVAALTPPTRDILRAASAAGRRTDDALLEAALGQPPEVIAGALREAIDAGILEQAANAGGVRGPAAHGGYVFHHALLREVVYDELLPGERRRLHAAFADLLTARGEVGGVPVAAADLAYHWLAAADPPKAVPAAVDAGRTAEGAYAFSEAAAWYDRALDLWALVPEASRLAGIDRVTLLQRAAETHVLVGDHEGAIRLGREALAIAVVEGRDPLRIGHLHDRLRWFQWDAGDHEGAAASLNEALAVIPPEPPTTIRARALAQLAGVEMHVGRFEAAAHAAELAIEVARASGGRGEEALSLGVLGWVTALRGDPEQGIALYREGLAIAEELRGVEGIALGYAELARMLDAIGRPEESLAAARDGFAVTSRLGLERTYGGILLGHAINSLLDLGRWDEARAALETALRTGYTGRPALWIRINEARLETGVGDLDAAAVAIAAAQTLHEGLRGSELQPRLLACIAELGVGRGDVTAVRAAWDQAWSGTLPGALPDPAVGWLGALALRAEADELERVTIHRDEAARSVVVARLARIASILIDVDDALRRLTGDAPREPRLVAIEATCRAEAARARGEPAADRWAAAVAAWDLARRPGHAAYARLRLAESTVAHREQRAVSKAALWEGHALAVRLGAAPLRSRFEELARRARIDLATGPADADADAPDARASTLGLTPRELEILRLVASGWSNQQIADRLFISRKTASVHVSNILGKLAVERREEAAAVAHRVGLGRDSPPPPGSEPVA